MPAPRELHTDPCACVQRQIWAHLPGSDSSAPSGTAPSPACPVESQSAGAAGDSLRVVGAATLSPPQGTAPEPLSPCS